MFMSGFIQLPSPLLDIQVTFIFIVIAAISILDIKFFFSSCYSKCRTTSLRYILKSGIVRSENFKYFTRCFKDYVDSASISYTAWCGYDFSFV